MLRVWQKFNRLYNLQIKKHGNNEISIPKMLRKSVGHDFSYTLTNLPGNVQL